jgi:CheY-like chemotaxis protein/HPt (histidine-containing phosphotransfer) domain-containing protein
VASAQYRTLIVDDNPGDARLIELALRGNPPGEFALRHVVRADAAVELVLAGEVEVALMDLHLPDADGPVGIARLRAASADLPLLALSGSQDPALIAAALAAGADGFQRKEHYPRGALARLLRGTIAGRRAILRLIEGDRATEGLEESPDGFVVLADGRLEYANPTARAVLDGAGADVSTLWAATQPSNGDSVGVAMGEFRSASPRGGDGPLRWTAWRSSGSPSRAVIRLEQVGTRTPVQGPPHAFPVPPAAAPVLDAATWADLREQAGDDTTFLPQLVRLFREYGAQLTAELREAAGRSDVPAVGRVAHTLRSSAAQVGALGLADQAAQLERECAAGHATAALSRTPGVIREYERALEALRGGPPAA